MRKKEYFNSRLSHAFFHNIFNVLEKRRFWIKIRPKTFDTVGQSFAVYLQH